MKKKNLLSGFIVLGLLGGCVSEEQSTSADSESEGGGTEQESINLRLNAGLSGEDANVAGFTTPWMETVEEETGGQVTFDAFFNQELVPLGEEIRALKDGTIDLAAPVLPTYSPDQFPLSDVPLLPLKASDTIIAAKAYADLIRSDVELADGKTFADFEFGQYGMKALPVQPTSEYTIGAVGDHVFSDVASLQNLSLRTSGRAHELFVKELGSGSVSMPWSEEFEALSRGALDGSVRSIVDYKSYGFDELITTTITGLAIGHFPLIWLMPEDEWNELPEDVQTIMEDTAYELANTTVKQEAFDQAWIDAEEVGIRLIAVTDLEQDAQDLIEKASTNTWQAWIDAKESEGLPGLETAKLWRDLVIKHGGEVHDPILELE